MEGNIGVLEQKVYDLENQLTDPVIYTDVDKLMKANQEYEVAKAQLDKANKNWEAKAMECERLENQ